MFSSNWNGGAGGGIIQPDYNSFKDKTEEYKNDAYVKGLLKLINDDIERNCK